MIIPSPRANRRARIEIVPLIDIIFFLLATFVMVSLSMVKNQGVEVKLPVAATSAPLERQDQVTLSVTGEGMYFFNKEPVGLEQLSEKLRRLRQIAPETKVLINGDGRAPFERVVALLDATRKAGLTRVAIETTKK
ncbi:MAG: biopolymer transporter ExbD [Verrucomicrobiae bacterium]|nr:biopolymer transporter ExbD [Verrucomicrobiae bacterium]